MNLLLDLCIKQPDANIWNHYLVEFSIESFNAASMSGSIETPVNGGVIASEPVSAGVSVSVLCSGAEYVSSLEVLKMVLLEPTMLAVIVSPSFALSR